jgi:hypothetical protein
MSEMLVLLGKHAGLILNFQSAAEMGVKGNPHGFTNGWFNWPFNFDPIWLESCNGFKQKGI